MAAKQNWTFGRVVNRLNDIRTRLDELEIGGRGVRGALHAAYQRLGAKDQSLRRGICYLGWAELTPWTAAALADISISEAQDRLELLIDVHFVAARLTPECRTWYRCDPLTLAYGYERAQADGLPDVRDAMLVRAFGARLAQADAAHLAMRGRFTNPRGTAARWAPADSSPRSLNNGHGAEWFRTGLPLIMSAVKWSSDTGISEQCRELAIAPAPLFESGNCFEEWHDSHQLALDCVRLVGDTRGEAALLRSLQARSLLLLDHPRPVRYGTRQVT